MFGSHFQTQNNQGLATDHFKMEDDHFEVNRDDCKADNEHFKVGGDHFDVITLKWAVISVR